MDKADSSTIAKHVSQLHQKLAHIMPHHPPTLMAVSKTHSSSAIEAAYLAGIRHFGENRVQEALAKFPELKHNHPDLVLHLIGPLQTNKVKDALRLFDVIHTLDRKKLAESLAKERDQGAKLPDLYIQVNIGLEPQKAGIAPKEADGFIRYAKDELQLPVIGLMCIPPQDQDPRPFFQALRALATTFQLPELSMGMSADYAIATEEGSTIVRVGSAIFGERG